MAKAGYKYVPYYPMTVDGSRDLTKTDLWAVEVTDGVFAGLRYFYSTWDLKTEMDPIQAKEVRRLNFKYEILPDSKIEEPAESDQKLHMQSLMGNILLNILVEVSRIEWPKKESKD
jgi:hypothetical protein